MMLKPRKLGTTVRHSFSKIEAATEMPNLIEVQKDSYEWFLKEGLNEVLRDVSPIVDYTGNLSIEFTDYTIDPTPRYPVEECKDRSVTYDAHMKVGVRLVNKATGELKTAQIFLGDFPLMTDNGTFVINGAERVIVSQLVRSPGMYYADEVDKQGKHNFTATVIPYRGAWLEYETDAAGIFYVKIDKNRKIPISTLIRALSADGEDNDDAILAMFGNEEALKATLVKDECNALAEENGTTYREEALKVMKAIHNTSSASAVAIWFDDFLVAGRDFNNQIEDKIKESDAMALVVTPNLLEKGNYVQRLEYPKHKLFPRNAFISCKKVLH